MQELAEDRSKLEIIGQAARARVCEYFTWEIKARQVEEIYQCIFEPSNNKIDILAWISIAAIK